MPSNLIITIDLNSTIFLSLIKTEPANDIPKKDELVGKRKRLEDAIKKRNKSDLDSALADFEALLTSDQLKREEKPLLDKAHETQKQLLSVDGMFHFMTCFKSLAISL